jgi:signal transduction histidine kinase
VAAAKSLDGRLWLVNTLSLSAFDPRRPVRNNVVPPVYVEQVVADQTRHVAKNPVALPPHTRNVEIHYVGLSFSAPQKMRFRYRLDGVDDTWQDVGTRRQAFYSDLAPGRYRFRVIASNNDGVWNEAGATIDLVVAPAWYQTNAFWAFCMVATVLGVLTLYQLRIRQVARSLNARFDERLAERTRVAREIHDTLLQTVQGSKMVADHALSRPDTEGVRRALEQVSGWLGQASAEGRAAISALRASTTETNDLAEALGRAVEDCTRQASIEATLSVVGTARDMHPVVRDEIYRIGYEAIRNACTHSGGTRLNVGLTYGQDLVIRVTDNGVGIDPSIANAGRPGHYGLPGLRERAARIGAKLTISSTASAGTEVAVVVPGRVIFRKS